jgi:hypothetical protein
MHWLPGDRKLLADNLAGLALSNRKRSREEGTSQCQPRE